MRRFAALRVSDGTRTRDRLDHNQGVSSQSSLGFPLYTTRFAAFEGIVSRGARQRIPLDAGRSRWFRAQLTGLGASDGEGHIHSPLPHTGPRRSSHAGRPRPAVNHAGAKATGKGPLWTGRGRGQAPCLEEASSGSGASGVIHTTTPLRSMPFSESLKKRRRTTGAACAEDGVTGRQRDRQMRRALSSNTAGRSRASTNSTPISRPFGSISRFRSPLAWLSSGSMTTVSSARPVRSGFSQR
jgi:hypothetical protein